MGKNLKSTIVTVGMIRVNRSPKRNELAVGTDAVGEGQEGAGGDSRPV